jgi:aspartyl protease family protein
MSVSEADHGRGPGDDMLRFAVIVAVGACFLGLVAPNLLLTFFSNDARGPAQTIAAPAKANVALSPPAQSDAAEASIDADGGGQYATEVYINGAPVRMLVDTGATMVVISYQTASRIGLQVLNADYTGRAQTANGVAAVAPVTLREVTIGPIYLGDVKALVAAPDAGAVDLLGMSFLKRLASVEQRSGKLILRQ